MDSIAYGKLSVVPWNIVSYNIFPGTSDRGPNLYGTSPSSFYFLNLLLNFNILVPFALLSLPALAVTYVYDRKRLGFMKSSPEQSSPFTILGLKLAPFYLWLAILTIQEHKEERFMFPAYAMLCFNAAVTVYLVRGWMETVFVTLTKSPYRVGILSFRTQPRKLTIPILSTRLPARLFSARLRPRSSFLQQSFPYLAYLQTGTIITHLSLSLTPSSPTNFLCSSTRRIFYLYLSCLRALFPATGKSAKKGSTFRRSANSI